MYLTEMQASEHIGRSTRQLHNWRDQGLPHTMQPGIGRLYRTDDLEAMRDERAANYRANCGRPRTREN